MLNLCTIVTVVPQILKDALHVTSQNIEVEMSKTLKVAFQYTGKNDESTKMQTSC